MNKPNNINSEITKLRKQYLKRCYKLYKTFHFHIEEVTKDYILFEIFKNKQCKELLEVSEVFIRNNRVSYLSK